MKTLIDSELLEALLISKYRNFFPLDTKWKFLRKMTSREMKEPIIPEGKIYLFIGKEGFVFMPL